MFHDMSGLAPNSEVTIWASACGPLIGKAFRSDVTTSVHARVVPFMPRKPQISATDRDFLVSPSVARAQPESSEAPLGNYDQLAD
jgi:hypothetical protein